MKLHFLLLLLLVIPAAAHTPKLLPSQSSSQSPFHIVDLDTSQAFYSTLAGSPHYYTFKATTPRTLSLRLLTPLIDSPPNLQLTLTKDETILHTLSSESWTPLYEEHGGDWYLQGNNASYLLEVGTYGLTIRSSTNQGHYILIIGEEEDISGDLFYGFLFLPFIKQIHFSKPVYPLFFHLAGIIIALGLLTILYLFLYFPHHGKSCDKLVLHHLPFFSTIYWFGFWVTTLSWVWIAWLFPQHLGTLVKSILFAIIFANSLWLFRILRNPALRAHSTMRGLTLNAIISFFSWWMAVFFTAVMI